MSPKTVKEYDATDIPLNVPPTSNSPFAAAAAVAAELASASDPDSHDSVASAAARKDAATWWINGVFVIFVHIVAAIALVTYKPVWQTWVLAVVSWQLSTLGITAGYHRLFSHRAYNAHPLVRAVLVFMGTMAFQGSVKWWVLRHRLHHRFTDTVHDPYNAKRGFWHSHMGWIFEKPHYPKMKTVDATDLNEDPIIVFQHRHYPVLALLSGLALPTLIACLWGDPIGGYLYGGVVARVAVWHVTFFINSFAHWTGDQLYSTEVSARGNLLLAVLTNGEGYHNFHHEFPKDYRNGIQWFDWDPTKWVIYFLNCFGLATHLTTVSNNEIMRAKVQTLAKQCAWGPPSTTLPNMTPSDVSSLIASGRTVTTLDGYVLDVTNFLDRHPGGRKLLLRFNGKDCGVGFNGGLNNHTQSARALTVELRVGKLERSDVLGDKTTEACREEVMVGWSNKKD